MRGLSFLIIGLNESAGTVISTLCELQRLRLELAASAGFSTPRSTAFLVHQAILAKHGFLTRLTWRSVLSYCSENGFAVADEPGGIPEMNVAQVLWYGLQSASRYQQQAFFALSADQKISPMAGVSGKRLTKVISAFLSNLSLDVATCAEKSAILIRKASLPHLQFPPVLLDNTFENLTSSLAMFTRMNSPNSIADITL